MTTTVREVALDLISREEDSTMTRMKIKRVLLKTDIRGIPATTKAREVALEAATEVATEVATEAVTEAATEAATEVATEVATEAATEVATEAATEAASEAATEVATEAVTEPTEVTARDLLEDTTQRKVDQAPGPEVLLLADTMIEVAAVATTEWPHLDMEAKVDIPLIIPSQLSDKIHSRMSSLTHKVIPEEGFTFCITTTEVA